jgi:hypothetical protein
VFLVNVPLVLAALAVGLKILHESRDRAGARPDAAGAALLAGGIGALALAIVEGPDWGWGSAPVVGLLAASVLLVAPVAARSTRHRPRSLSRSCSRFAASRSPAWQSSSSSWASG